MCIFLCRTDHNLIPDCRESRLQFVYTWNPYEDGGIYKYCLCRIRRRWRGTEETYLYGDRFKVLLCLRGVYQQAAGPADDESGCCGYGEDGENNLPRGHTFPEKIRDFRKSQAV